MDYHLDLLEPLGLYPVRPKDGASDWLLFPNVDTPALPQPIIWCYIPAQERQSGSGRSTNWSELAAKLRQSGYDILLTGSGPHEAEISANIKRTLPSAIDLCGRLSFPQFVRITQNARLLVGVNSLAGHLAAATATPSVLIYDRNQQHAVATLRPAFGSGDLEVPCSPCFRTNGCAEMECVRNVTVARVFQLCLESLERSMPKLNVS